MPGIAEGLKPLKSSVKSQTWVEIQQILLTPDLGAAAAYMFSAFAFSHLRRFKKRRNSTANVLILKNAPFSYPAR